MSTQCWPDAGPPSAIKAQHQPIIQPAFRVVAAQWLLTLTVAELQHALSVNQTGEGGGGGLVQCFGKSEIAGSNPAPAFKSRRNKMFLPPAHSYRFNIVGSLRDRKLACLSSDRQGLYFDSCVWRAVSSCESHLPQGVLLAQFSLYVHKGGLKPDSFHFI